VRELDAFFAPRAVAVVGAAREETKVGHAVFDYILAGGFPGPVYPVNPNADEVHGHHCYATVRDVPRPVDLAVVVVPAAAALGVLDDCAEAGCTAIIVLSAGFKEIGPQGAAAERELVASAHRLGLRILGPNCLGLVAPHSRLNASFARVVPGPGSIAFMSQSGALGTAMLDRLAGEGIGISAFVSLGNKADIDEVDLIRAWTEDGTASVVTAYLESVADGAAFVEAAIALTARKPFVVLKAGRSDAGARAVSSHTGSLAGSEAAYTAAFLKAGVIRAATVEELTDIAVGFSMQPLPRGDGVAILTNAGGPAIVATDACVSRGLSLASLDRRTIDALRSALPAAASPYNPVDVLGDADESRYAAAASVLLADPNVHTLLVVLTPQAPTRPVETAHALAAAASASGKTTLACFMGGESVSAGKAVLLESRIPALAFPEQAISVLAAMVHHAGRRRAPASVRTSIQGDVPLVRETIAHARAAGRTFITERSAARVAEAYGIPIPAGSTARDLVEGLRIADEIGYPVVVKIASPDILHKSDIGGIRTGVGDATALATAYDEVTSNARRLIPEAHVWGVTVQSQAPAGREVIVGVRRDPQFGPVLMAGLGGIYVEVLKDVAFRLCPVTEAEAREMLTEIRAYGLLRGTRGARPADIDAVIDVIVRVSALVVDFEDIVELDINPLIVQDGGGGALAVDVRIGIGG